MYEDGRSDVWYAVLLEAVVVAVVVTVGVWVPVLREFNPDDVGVPLVVWRSELDATPAFLRFLAISGAEVQVAEDPTAVRNDS